jgi:hypothetical protein
MLFGIEPSSLGFTALGIPFIGTRIIGLHPLRVTPTHSPITAFSGSLLWGNPRIPAPPNPASLGSSQHTRIRGVPQQRKHQQPLQTYMKLETVAKGITSLYRYLVEVQHECAISSFMLVYLV